MMITMRRNDPSAWSAPSSVPLRWGARKTQRDFAQGVLVEETKQGVEEEWRIRRPCPPPLPSPKGPLQPLQREIPPAHTP